MYLFISSCRTIDILHNECKYIHIVILINYTKYQSSQRTSSTAVYSVLRSMLTETSRSQTGPVSDKNNHCLFGVGVLFCLRSTYDYGP